MKPWVLYVHGLCRYGSLCSTFENPVLCQKQENPWDTPGLVLVEIFHFSFPHHSLFWCQIDSSFYYIREPLNSIHNRFTQIVHKLIVSNEFQFIYNITFYVIKARLKDISHISLFLHLSSVKYWTHSLEALRLKLREHVPGAMAQVYCLLISEQRHQMDGLTQSLWCCGVFRLQQS